MTIPMAEEPDSPESAGDSSQQDRRAPSYTVPRERIVSLDHPCIVKNVDNGIKSLGGEHQLKMVRFTARSLLDGEALTAYDSSSWSAALATT